MIPFEYLSEMSEESLRAYAEQLDRYRLRVIDLADRLAQAEADRRAWERRIAERKPPAWEQRRAELQARWNEIMRLAGRGWTNDQIGRKVKMHPNSVSRVIAKHKPGGDRKHA